MMVLMALPVEARRKQTEPQDDETTVEPITLPGVRRPAYREHYCTINEDGESIMVVLMNPITVLPEWKFKNKKEEQFYWRTVRDVKKALPYAKLISETLIETYEYIETFPTQRERDQYLKDMEDAIFKQYKPYLRNFSRTQAKVLVKLIQRETHQSGYSIIKAFLGTFRATFWQGFGRLFGVNLKGEYHPESNREDAIIERICLRVEEGSI